MQTRRKAGVIVVAVSLVCLCIGAYGFLNPSTPISNSGHIGLLRVYQDMECTIPVMAFDWGTLGPGGSDSKTVWVKNTAGETLTLSLTLNSTTISPANLLDYMQVSWNRESAMIGPESVLETTFTINVYLNATEMTETAFSFDDIITGTGA